MEVNQVYSGCKLVKIVELKDTDSTLYEFHHEKSGATICYIANDDTNKVFMAGFRTLPENSTGVPHIIEHSLLCGSKKYPLKEPFVNLLKGSMSTYLNAMTSTDWTAYPVASPNDKDFDNLTKVYLDAVFNPLSMENPHAFLQEGWHLEMFKEDDIPFYNGVVYNEMKGVMSSVDDLVEYAKAKAMYSGCTYEVNSGGDPEIIPTLTYDDYKAFYKKFYHPSNGIFYYYGKMNIEEKLAYLVNEYLDHYEDPKTRIHAPFATERINEDYVEEYPISSEEDEKDNTYFNFSFKVCKNDDIYAIDTMKLIDDYLLSSNDSPLTKALLDKNICVDVSSNVDDSNAWITFSVTAEKSNLNQKENFKKTFYEVINETIKNGFNKERLLAFINNAEFKYKENDTGSTPKGLMQGITVLQDFIYENPLDLNLHSSKEYAFLKAQLSTDYYEKFLKKIIIDSSYYALVTLKPNKKLEKINEEKLNAKMQAIKAKMTQEDIAKCIALNKDLKAYQNHVDTIEEIATLPRLNKEDIKINLLTLPSEELKEELNYYLHDVNTNGIGYMNLYFKANNIEEKDLPYLSLLNGLLRNLDTENYKLNELNTKVKTYLGSFFTHFEVYGRDAKQVYCYFVVTASALKENISYIHEIFNEVMWKTIFNEEKIRTILLQLSATIKERIITSGHSVGLALLSESYSLSGKANSLIGGYRLYTFVQNLLKKKDLDEDIKILKELLNKIISKDNLIASLSGKEEVTLLKEEVKKLKLNNYQYTETLNLTLSPKQRTALIIPSQVSYDCLSFSLDEKGLEYTGKYALMKKIINYDYLWPEIRVKGGAYGCGISFNVDHQVSFMSYRDPHVKETYSIYNKIQEFVKNYHPSDEEFLTSLIGTMGNYDKPCSICTKINSLDRFKLEGFDDNSRLKLREETLATTKEDIIEFSKMFTDIDKASICVVGNETEIKKYHFDQIEKF